MAEMNTAEIEKLLGNLKSEVDDLHPHLQGLFNRIENISVEYTHGPSEYGADFILTRQDDITGETRYVGVIAKNKGINQGAVEEVGNQIGECIKIKRPINNGTNSVRMNDVWVIANGNISNNAKEKIEQTTQMGGITYFDRNKLAGLIIRYNYIFTDDLPTNISICLSKQSELAERLKRQSLGSGYFDSEKIFINQRVIKIESHHYAQNKRRQQTSTPTSIETAVEDNPTLILYGEPGSGKSKMLQQILSHAAKVKQFKNTKIIPIFSTCQDVLERYDGNISNLIFDFKKDHNLKKIDPDIHYMVIIDGIDECDLTFDERQDIMERWKKESAQENVKNLILASRDRFEEKTLGIPIYRVAGLSGKEVINVIRKHLSAIDNVDRLVQDIQSSDIFSSLPKSPLAVVILINLLKDKNGRNELPANLTDLFAKYAECTLGRWSTDVSEGMRQKRYEAANKILTLIAQYMVDHQLHQITEDEAKLHFEKYLKERNLGIETDGLFDYVIDHSNFVYVDDGSFQFRHRTFTEFFYSKAFSEEKLENLGGDVFDVQWTTILFFYIGHKKDCPGLLEKINSIKPQRESGKFLKAVNMANYLLAAYATPYDCIQKFLQSTFIDAANYIENVLNGETDLFSKFSKMRSLCYFRLVIDHQYSRPFFKDAIADSLISTEDSHLSDNVKATSLFLLDIVYRSLGGENIFEHMIKNPKFLVPIHIQLAINHETDSMEHLGGDLKKYKRALKRSLVNKSSSLDNLYNKELRLLS